MRWLAMVGLSLSCMFACGGGVDTSEDKRQPTVDEIAEMRALMQAYIDLRYEATDSDRETLAAFIGNFDVNATDIAGYLAKGRVSYVDKPVAPGASGRLQIDAYHVDYSTNAYLSVPSTYADDTPTPLLVVGHGGNSCMSESRAGSVASSYASAYAELAARMGAIILTPPSERGWGHIGNSVIHTGIYEVARAYNVDPQRIYVVGQSMGGHLSYRSARDIGDWFAGVGPASGGADWLNEDNLGNLYNVPGFVTWGENEPYMIAEYNRGYKAWLGARGYDWVLKEMAGRGHEIFDETFAEAAAFFAARPRDIAPETVYFRRGGAMRFTSTWGVDCWPAHEVRLARPLQYNSAHWLEVEPHPDGAIVEVVARRSGNEVRITSENLRQARLWFAAETQGEVVVVANGSEVFRGPAERDPMATIDHVRKRADWGRLWRGYVDIAVQDDRAVNAP